MRSPIFISALNDAREFGDDNEEPAMAAASRKNQDTIATLDAMLKTRKRSWRIRVGFSRNSRRICSAGRVE